MADEGRKPGGDDSGRGPGWVDPDLRVLPSERAVRKPSRRAVILFAIVGAMIAHALMLSGCAGLLLLFLPPAPPPVEDSGIEVMPTFVPPPVAPRIAAKPPDTPNVSSVDTEAESPGAGPPQPHGDETARQEGPTERPRETKPPTPEPRPQAIEPTDEASREERQPSETPQQRVARALRGLSGRSGEDWSLPSGDGSGSSGLGYGFGGADFQIESRSNADFGPWSERVRTIVKGNWYDIMPVAAKLGMKGVVRVRFVVHRDGSLSDWEMLDSSGIAPLDSAVRSALLDLSNPLPPLPLREGDDDTIRITYTFVYNLRDDREQRAWERQRWIEQRRAGG